VEVYREKRDLRGAIGELTRLLKRTPDSVPARKLLVQLYVQSRNPDRAMATIDEAISRNPTLALWHEAKGDLLVLLGRLEDATPEFREAYTLQPNGSRLAKYAEMALANDPPAYADLEAAVSSTPELVDGRPLLRNLYARALSGVGRNDDAMQQMRVAYREHREKLDAGTTTRAAQVNWLRSLQSVMADQEPAEYERFITELADGQPEAVELLWIGRVWAASGPEGLNRGIELLHTALVRCPADDTALRAQLELDLGQFEVAVGNVQTAVEAFERALEIEPNNVLALNNAAFIYAEHLGAPGKALPYAERAVAEVPTEGTVLDTLGWTYYRVGRYEEAEEFLRRSIKARPMADNHLHLAFVLFETARDLEPEPGAKRLDNARTYLRRAAELGPPPDLQTEIDRLAEEIEALARRFVNSRRR
jgi:tetratricopeptide (TPR) repeat protein